MIPAGYAHGHSVYADKIRNTVMVGHRLLIEQGPGFRMRKNCRERAANRYAVLHGLDLLVDVNESCCSLFRWLTSSQLYSGTLNFKLVLLQPVEEERQKKGVASQIWSSGCCDSLQLGSSYAARRCRNATQTGKEPETHVRLK